MSFKIMSELSCTHDYSVTYLLHLRIIFLADGEGFKTKYIGTSCDSFLPSLHVSRSWMRAPLTALCTVETYKMSGWSDCGLASVDNFCM
jgi:hypothetical protein